jgi:hypothetical protein
MDNDNYHNTIQRLVTISEQLTILLASHQTYVARLDTAIERLDTAIQDIRTLLTRIIEQSTNGRNV